jgi:polygalacturonase
MNSSFARQTARILSRTTSLLIAVLALGALAGGGLACTQSLRKSGSLYDVREYGALSDGKTKSTEAIRKAIAAAVAGGGGTIFFPAGQYLTGPIHMKSNVTLLIDAGAVLRFSPDFDDYLPMVSSQWEGTAVTNFSPLIYGHKLENIAIHGRGILDGQGEAWWNYFKALERDHAASGVWKKDSRWQREFARLNQTIPLPDDTKRIEMGFLRPPFIQFLDSRNVSIKDVTIRNSPFWTINPVYCDDVTITGVTIENPDGAPNTDGIDPESCKNVHISDCHISVGDDCVCIKSGRDEPARQINRPAENHTITNSTMLRGHGGVVIGSEMSGGVKNIAVSNCVFDGTDRGIRIKSTRGRGGTVENVRVSNIVMSHIREEAITLNLFYTNVPPEAVSLRTPHFREIHLSGISGDAETAGVLLGLEESPLENVTLSDIALSTRKGLTIRNARNVELRGVRIDAQTGPAISAERAENLELSDVKTAAPRRGTPVVRLSNVNRSYLHGAFAAPGTDVFLEVTGSGSTGIVVEDNHLLGANVPIVVAADTKDGAVLTAAPIRRASRPGTSTTELAQDGGSGSFRSP